MVVSASFSISRMARRMHCPVRSGSQAKYISMTPQSLNRASDESAEYTYPLFSRSSWLRREFMLGPPR